MAEKEMAEKEALDKKAAKKAAKAKKKNEKKQSKSLAKAGGAEDEEEAGGSKLVIFFVSLLIIVIWLGILGLLVRLDVGGFGSTVLYPVLKDVPYINKILPEKPAGDADKEEVVDVQYPYATLEEAIKRIKELEVELSEVQKSKEADQEKISQLEAEVARLQQFEAEQAAFQELKTKFYKEVVFSDNAPDISNYQAYYESIDAANAAELYKQVIQQVDSDAQVQEYASTYAAMKPKQAAAIMEQMTDNLNLVAQILDNMAVDARGNILGAMDPKIAAQVTKLMEPKEP